MLIESNFQSDSNDREILPAEFSSHPYICMLTDLIKYNGIFPWHWHSALEIDYIVEGDIEFQTPEYQALLKKGDAVFINSEILHTYHARSSSACKLHAILFDAHFISGMYHSLLEDKYVYPILKNQQLEAFHIHPGTPHSAAMIENIQKIVALSVSEPFGYEFAVRSALSSFWCDLLEDTEEMRAVRTQKSYADTTRIKLMLQFIHTHYGARITLQDIAASANISSRECSRCFQRCISTSPMGYLCSYRVHIASDLLRQTDDSITAISENCGFSSPGYFGKVFHHATGRTPLEYRRANK